MPASLQNDAIDVLRTGSEFQQAWCWIMLEHPRTGDGNTVFALNHKEPNKFKRATVSSAATTRERPRARTYADGVIFRGAVHDDLPAIVALLADDVLGAGRDRPTVDEAYERAFADIEADPRNLLVVADDDGEVVACMQITYIPGLGRHGTERCQIEAVRVRSDRRGQGLGRQFMTWAIEQARKRGCGLVQLTSDKSRVDAHRFYARLGFVASHEGMKLAL